MLTHQFDLTIARFASVDDVDLEELKKADIVEIRQKVPGAIYHSRSMVWRGWLEGKKTPEAFIRSKKERKAVLANIEAFKKDGYRFETKEMTPQLYEEFVLLYQETTLKRERALSFDLNEVVWGKALAGNPVFLIGLFQGERLESGLVFSINKKKEVLVSYGAKRKFTGRRGGVGGVLEYFLLEFCLANQINEISHGKATNPAGLTGKSGIFEFKARYGFSAFPMEYWVSTFIKNPQKIGLSDFVFVTVLNDDIGYVVVTDLSEKEVVKKYATREVKEIKIFSHQEVASSFQQFVERVGNKT